MPYYPGKWQAICDVCGFSFLNDQLKDRWDGLKVCAKDWEPRHPQDYLRVPPERPGVPWTRPEPPDVFIGPVYTADSYYWAQDYTTPDDTDFSANRYIDAGA